MRLIAAAFALCLSAGITLAETAQQITWADLAPGQGAQVNPFLGLTADESRLVGILVEVAQARAAGQSLTPRMQKGETIALDALDSVGIDGRAKVQAVAAFDTHLQTHRTQLNTGLLDQRVEIPGFVLPLAFDGMNVTQFLLVPYAGACVHTPPPPRNQMIVVTVPEGYAMRSLFEPIVVTGQLSRSGDRHAVDFSDGAAAFEVGYGMTADRVRAF